MGWVVFGGVGGVVGRGQIQFLVGWRWWMKKSGGVEGWRVVGREVGGHGAGKGGKGRWGEREGREERAGTRVGGRRGQGAGRGGGEGAGGRTGQGRRQEGEGPSKYLNYLKKNNYLIPGPN